MTAAQVPVVVRGQRILLHLGYWAFKPLALFARRKIDWVVGTEEIAHMVTHIAEALPHSFSVVHLPHRFYDSNYDLVIQEPSRRFNVYRRLYAGPLALAWLVNRAQGFIYVGPSGFLADYFDSREAEFAFITRHKKRIVCYFTGNDIRSPLKMKQLEERMGTPNLGTFLPELDPVFTTPEYDHVRRERARMADHYADVIFNARVDQLSYIEKDTEPFMYFYPDEAFHHNQDKFDSLDRIVIVHAPSSPILKGTAHVRAAIKRLQAEGYEFDYQELTGVTNQEVLAALAEAHISLNEFYAFVPGVFGIESMAQNCALLTSADATIETDLDEGANEAWVVTRHDEVYVKLKHLLDHPQLIQPQAERGYAWALKNASGSESTRRLRAILER